MHTSPTQPPPQPKRAYRSKLTHDEAAAVMLAAGLEPLEPYLGSGARWLCRCTTCGSEVLPRYSVVQQGKGGCSYCAKRARPKLTHDEAAAVMRAVGLEPIMEYPGSSKSWLCRCTTCTSEVLPRYNNVQQGKAGGCSYCAEQGFKAKLPAQVFLVHHADSHAIKVGVGGVEVASKLDLLARHGWQIVASWDMPTGSDARRIEQAVLRWWRDELRTSQVMRPEGVPRLAWGETATALGGVLGMTLVRLDQLTQEHDAE
jgi:hypothetical protein